MVRKFILAASLIVIAGCSGEPDLLAQPAMLIAPGYIQLQSGRAVQVLGYDRCDLDSGFRLIGNLKDETGPSSHCTRVPASTQTFNITVGTSRGMVTETWHVVATETSIQLQRPSGDAVTVFRVNR